MDLLNPHQFDDVSRLLRDVNLRSVVYCVSDLGAPWGFGVEHSAVAKFHLVLDGHALLSVDGLEDDVELETGHLVLLPHGTGHVMRDRPGSRVRRLDRIVIEHPVDDAHRLTYGGKGRRTSLLCGGFELAGTLPDELHDLLPPVLVLDAASNGLSQWLDPTFALLREETAGPTAGSAVVMAKIADVFLAQVLRTYLAGSNAATNPLRLAASDDPAIAEAATLLRRQSARDWTVGSLAREVGMSRTALAARFRAAVGEPPMAYLARVRLSQAAGYLSATNDNLNRIAHLVGYSNEAALSKAFKRTFGRSPSDYRRERLVAPAMQS